jgi:hypothetical protein
VPLAEIQKTVSRSVRISRVTPPRSSRQRTSRSKLTSRVQQVAIRIAGRRLWPSTATMACSSTISSPSGQLPMCFQSAWVCTPGAVSKRTSGSTGIAGRRGTSWRRQVE